MALVEEHGRDYVLKEAIFRRKLVMILLMKKRVVRIKGSCSSSSSSTHRHSVCLLCIAAVDHEVRIMHMEKEVLGEV